MLKTKVHFLFSGIIITVATCRLAEIAPLDIRPSPPHADRFRSNQHTLEPNCT